MISDPQSAHSLCKESHALAGDGTIGWNANRVGILLNLQWSYILFLSASTATISPSRQNFYTSRYQLGQARTQRCPHSDILL